MNLEDRVVAITGATGALGQYVSQVMAENGASLALMGRDAEKLNQLAKRVGVPGDRFVVSPGDLSTPYGAKEALKTITDKFGNVDILLHFVGGWSGGVTLIDVKKEEISAMIQQHLWTTFNLTREFVPKMVENQWGRIIVISSPFAFSPRAKGGPYAIGKAAQEALVLTLAQELKGSGVTSNILLVKTIDTDNKRDLSPSHKNASWTTLDEISGAIMYLVSDQARIVNGARLPLFGSPE